MRRAKPRFQQAFVGIGIDHFQLAVEHVDEGVHRIADLGHDFTRLVKSLSADLADRIDMRVGQRNAPHSFQIFAKLFHTSRLHSHNV